MVQVIYRKYRPMAFSDVTGQSHVKTTLENQIKAGTVGHAYLFSGARGIGKTTIARLLAKSMNCQNRKDNESEPCNECENCIEMNEGRSMDIIEIDAASHTGVDNVRENIIDAVRFSPNKGQYKVFIIDEVHMLSTSAFNALLKTLEEPPAHAIFILATTEIHKIPQTILSRCQRFDFKRIGPEDMKKRLQVLLEGEKTQVDDGVLSAIARVSEGCLRDAESLLGQVLAIGDKKISMDVASLVLPQTHIQTAIDILSLASENQVKAIIEALGAFIEGGGSVKHLINDLIDVSRQAMMWSLSESYEMPLEGDMQSKVQTAAKRLGTSRIVELIDGLITAKGKLGLDSFPQLPLEILFVDFCEVTEQKVKDDEPPASSNIEKSTEKMPEAPSSTPKPVQDPPKQKEKEEFSQESEKTSTPSKDLKFSLDDVKNKWGRICEAVKKRNVALPLVLQGAKPQRIDGNTVVIGFEHSFHFDTMKEIKNQDLLSEGVEEVLQSRPRIEVEHVVAEEEKAATELADAFGGAVMG